jgi:hypothetical protein
MSADTPWRRRSVSTLLSKPAGTTRALRSDTRRSRIRATAMTEVSSKGQMGQPTAWMIENTQMNPLMSGMELYRRAA